ncbi:unnamed protein product [Tuber melanosporum]|uniref:(Perigord truffle) hypothetical protein n=1 Tax=Tuber melanosporum (strain Mel28) TaxID=656061 RepID=D5GBV1_TUBMM|nr:uncharacterized protein GSTUM_00005597001 [Tuber melanosporum]CAZ81951.1 unnamed protein product [Tuber melanosporum]
MRAAKKGVGIKSQWPDPFATKSSNSPSCLSLRRAYSEAGALRKAVKRRPVCYAPSHEAGSLAHAQPRIQKQIFFFLAARRGIWYIRVWVVPGDCHIYFFSCREVSSKMEDDQNTKTVSKKAERSVGKRGGGGEAKGRSRRNGRKRAKTIDQQPKNDEEMETVLAVEEGEGGGEKSTTATVATESKDVTDTKDVSETKEGTDQAKKLSSGRKKTTMKAAKRELSCNDHPTVVFKSNSDLRNHLSSHPRPYHCIFSFASCPQTFSSKNEWKRHVHSQHLLFNYWRCDQASCSPQTDPPPSPSGAREKNTFNRKDLFTLHVKRMHSTTVTMPEGLSDMVERCKRQRRKPPAWEKCGHCGRKWTREEFGEKMEHIGGHLEVDAGGEKAEGAEQGWRIDNEFIEWAVEEGIVERADLEKEKAVGVEGVILGGGERAKDFDGRYRLVNVVKPGTRGLKPST